MRLPSLAVVLVALMATCLSSPAHADVDNEPLFFRLTFALTRATNFSSTAGRQASTAYPGGSSANPAGDDWGQRDETQYEAEGTLIIGLTESGAVVTAEAVTITFLTDEWGTFTLAYARTDMPEGDIRGGLESDLRSNEFFLSYSKMVTDTCALGVQVRFVDADISSQAFTAALPGIPLQSDVELFGVDAVFGLLCQINDQWHAGVTGTIGWYDTETSTRNIAGPPGLVSLFVEDDIRIRGARVGVGYEPQERLSFYVDVEYIHFGSNTMGSADTARLLVGVEHAVSRSVAVRAGASIDIEADVTLSAGITYVGLDPVRLHLAYQYNGMPELDAEFGVVHVISLSATIDF